MDGFAFVRCTCFEEGKLINCPVPYDDLYVDTDGWLSSRSYDEFVYKLSKEDFRSRFGISIEELRDWLNQPCEHEQAVYIEDIPASSAMCEFRDVFEEAGIEHRGHPYDGFYPAACAPVILDFVRKKIEELPSKERENLERHRKAFNEIGSWELTYFFDHIALLSIERLALKAIETGHPIWFHFCIRRVCAECFGAPFWFIDSSLCQTLNLSFTVGVNSLLDQEQLSSFCLFFLLGTTLSVYRSYIVSERFILYF